MDGEPARLITNEALDEKQQVKFMNKRWRVVVTRGEEKGQHPRDSCNMQ